VGDGSMSGQISMLPPIPPLYGAMGLDVQGDTQQNVARTGASRSSVKGSYCG
jgi:hypothetical protein